MTRRFRHTLLLVVALGSTAMLVIGCDADARRRAAALASDTSVLDSGAVRQPIPRGIDPRMVEWRSDGVLIPSQDSLRKTPGYVVDSIFPPEEALRRFRAELGGDAPTRLTGGAPSLDVLLRRYWGLLARRDTFAMTPLVMNAKEFAWLYYPESGEAAAGLAPNISWLLLSANSGRGLARALAAADTAVTPAPLVGTACVPVTGAMGANRLYGPCGVIRRLGVRPDTVWVVQRIIARDGIFKLMSFSNDL